MTDAQLIVLGIIDRLWKDQGFAPSLREISAAGGWSSTKSVYEHLVRLRRDGFVNFVDRKSRTLTVTAAGREVLGR